MLDQLIKLVQRNAENDINNNSAIPDQYNKEAVNIVGHEIFTGLQNEGKKGNLTGLTDLFKGNNITGNNPIISAIISGVTTKFASKFGISPQIATQVASVLIPKVMNQFVNKAKDPNDKEFDLQDILKDLGGAGNIGNLIGQFTGGGKGGGLGSLGGLFGK
ncbi:hypothetical protein [Chryseosolibacter indicus]|uniref:DUF937 domain-containing protein n=1 Tax=Chryseosolibacter indicus TaxID=2782351 RepID=A0ABS5VMW1_9BACT|nr:hypothetical protein [Chryseosolibacter indicus]MBT1702185.1 DUF937 domain-containing protein [Chryseosolibacter indicus]